MNTSRNDLDTMVNQYIDTALWFLDENYTARDIANDTVHDMRADCIAFFESNAKELADTDPGQVGHDFWLTRNHHDARFEHGDRGLGKFGERLTKEAHAYGEYSLYVGDDGLIHGT